MSIIAKISRVFFPFTNEEQFHNFPVILLNISCPGYPVSGYEPPGNEIAEALMWVRGIVQSDNQPECISPI
jgi:hypothetical protein